MNKSRAFVAMMATLLVSSCSSIDDIRARPVAWTANYDRPFDEMAGCLAARNIQEHAVATDINQASGVARVTLAAKTGPTIFAEYTVRRINGNRSQVELQRAKSLVELGDLFVDMRTNADRCGAGG